ncbi:MAG: hypothetical protein U0271_13205 [Polyangiaceae bacterium]
MSGLAGVVFEVTAPLRALFQLDASAERAFVAAEEAHAVQFVGRVKRLATVDGVALGASVVGGRIVPAVFATPSDEVMIEKGLALVVAPRGEHVAFVLLGVRIIDVGVFAAVGEDRDGVSSPGGDAAVASTERALASLEAAAWFLRHGAREPHSSPGSDVKRRAPS